MKIRSWSTAKFILSFPIFFISLMSAPASAVDPGVEVKAGTLGLGADLVLGINDEFAARIGFSNIDEDDSFTDDDDIEYEAEVTLGGTYVFADWHPFQSGFRVTGGLVSNNNSVSAEADLTGVTIDIGDTEYNVGTDVSELSGDIEFDDLAPYIGIGWGSTNKSGTISFAMDIGVMIPGDASVDIDIESPSGAVSAADIADEEDELEDEAESLLNSDIYPVLSFGVAFRF